MIAPDRRSRQPAINIRLWILVSLVLLLVPFGITVARQSEGAPASDARAENAQPAPEGAVQGEAPQPTSTTSPATPAPTSTPMTEKPAPKPKKAKPRAVPKKGPGKYRTATLKVKPASKKGRVIRYRVKVEKNLDINANAAAKEIARTLNDKRSWRGDGSVRFQLVGKAKKTDLTIYLLTPGTTDKRCYPLNTRGKVSCQQGRSVNLNALRWVHGVKHFDGDVARYRQYLVNHEVGHSLGRGHRQCPVKGKRAPVMQQQTKGLGGCKANPWVKPSRK